MSWRRVLTAAAVLLAAATTAPPAGAHSADPNVHARIDAITPALPGVTIEVRSGVADQLLVVNTTPTPVEVLDTKGVPFLRIGNAGVEANYASADWYLSNSPLGLAATPSPDPAKTIDWRVVAHAGSWGWFDHRLHDRSRPLTDEMRKARTIVRLADWTVPLRYGGRLVTVTGHVEYRPLLGAFRTTVEHVPNGATVDVLDGRVPGLFLRWNGATPLLLEGIDGGAFALVGRDATRVNAANETWQEDQRLRGQQVTGPADATAIRWQVTGAKGQLTWLDRRLAYAPGVPPDDALRAGHPTTLVEWSIPASAGTTHDRISGTTTWIPNDVKPHRRNPVPFVVAAAVLLAGLTAIQRRVARR